MKPLVLITRPLEDAAATAREVEALGFAAFTEPMLTIHPLPFAMPENYHGLIFTSANAVRAAASVIENSDRPVYCVGDHTAEVARACGWTTIASAGGDAGDLLRTLKAEGFNPAQKLVHLSGFDISRNIELEDFTIERVVVYKAEKARELSARCLEIIDEKGFAAALFFSARSAQTFTEVLEKHGRTRSVKTIKALCLADSVVKSLRHLPWQDVQVAARPDFPSLTALLESIKQA